MRLTVLGNASGAVPGPGNGGSGYLVRGDGDALLLDCGNGVLGRLREHVDYDAVDALCLTHTHYDHTADLLPLSLYTRHMRPPLPTWGPPGTRDFLAGVFQAFGRDVDGNLAAFDLHPWRPREPVEMAGFTVTPFPVEHNAPEGAFAIRVERGGRALCFSGDTRPCEGLVEAARGVDLFLCEATVPQGVEWGGESHHMTATQAAEAAEAANVGRLLLTHLLYGHPVAESVAEAQETFTGAGAAEAGATYHV